MRGPDHSQCPHDPRRRSRRRGHVPQCCPIRLHMHPAGSVAVQLVDHAVFAVSLRAGFVALWISRRMIGSATCTARVSVASSSGRDGHEQRGQTVTAFPPPGIQRRPPGVRDVYQSSPTVLGVVDRGSGPCRCRRWISWVMEGWAMPSAAASVVSRIGPSSLSLPSARAAVRLSAAWSDMCRGEDRCLLEHLCDVLWAVAGM